MNRSFYLQILVLAVFISMMSSLNIFGQDHSVGEFPKINTAKDIYKVPDQNVTFDNPMATLGYAYSNSGLTTVSQPLPAGLPFTNLAGFTFPAFASSMTKGGDGNYYLTTTYNATGPVIPKLYTVSTGGVVTLLGDITGTGTNSVNGISYNPNNSTYYLMGATTPTNSLLYSFDINTRVATLIGTVGTGALMIDLCFDFSGTCYTYDLVTDNAYTVNITTAAATLLGPLGFAANFGQGMGYDFETGWIYLSAFRNVPSNDGQLRVMDPQTGYTNLLASYGVVQVAPFAPASTIAALPGPGRATNPTIANGATNVLLSTPSIGWTNPGGATSVEVFFGTNPLSLPSIYSGAVVTSRPVTLAASTTYYWYVNETSGGGTTKGTLWSFTTEALPCLTLPLPLFEDFESGVFPPLCWTRTGTVIWGINNTVSGYGDGTRSAMANFYNVSTGSDNLITIEYISTGAPNPALKFDWAYATYINDPDELDIYYSTDAGATWTILLAMPGGLTGILNPFQLATTSVYVPADNEWSSMTLPLPAGTNRVRFTAVTAFGNQCYLDNIRITPELFVDGFEAPTYVLPAQVACKNTPTWTTWTATPCGNDDATVSSAYAFTGTQSALIDAVSPRWVDLVKPLGNKTTGKWYITFFTYIPTGKGGYFNTLAVLPTPTADWGMEVYFDVGGGGRLMNVPGAPVNFPWTQATWNQAMVVIDFNATPTTAEFWFGKVGQLAQLYTWDWTQGSTITDQLGGVDIFAPTGTSTDEMYVDDFYFSDVPPPIQRLADDVGTFSIDMNYQYGPGTIIPYATFKNYGTASHTFNVTMTISGGYSSTKTVPSIDDGETYQVQFDNWNTTTVGPYTIDVCSQLAGDGNADNDCQTQGVHIWDESGTWTSGADYPTTTYNGVGVSYNDGTTNWLFVLGGNTTSLLRTECYKYNFTTNTWTPIASLPSGRLIHAASAVGDFIYVFGGSDGTLYTNTIYKYDIVANTWTLIGVLPINLGWARAASYLDRYIYVAGGYDGVSADYQNTVYLFDSNTETISVASPMPNTSIGGGFGITGTKLVHAGGAYITGITNEVMVGTISGGNPAVITWATMENTYPGIGKESYGQYGTNLAVEMHSQLTGQVNNHAPDAVVWPAGAIYRTHAHTWGNDAIIMAGGTPTSVYSAATPGPCYVYKPATDTWIAQENMIVPVGAHQSGTVNDGAIWKYILASGFGVTATETETQIYTQTLGGASTFQLSVDVINAWNMVAVPGTNTDGMGVNTWWAFRDLGASVFKFSGSYTPVLITDPGEGYWMKHNGPRTYNTGDEWPTGGIQIVAHDPVGASVGWNLVGGYDVSVPVGSVTTTPPGLINATIFGFNGAYTPATHIVPGYAYWIKLSAAGSINLGGPLGKEGAQYVQSVKEDWGKIIITDASGKSFTLYAAEGQVDLNYFEMPPVPPAGSFDVRFSSNRMAEDLSSSVQTIDMTSVEYPVTVTVENMSIRLMDETGKQLNENVEDGKQITISDSRISKLKVSGELIPTVYALEQNYPNPFNPSTTIEFSLPEDVNSVMLTVYNTLGERVAELVNGSLVAGTYSYQWNAQNVATGMYIYELRTDNFVSIKKMVLLK